MVNGVFSGKTEENLHILPAVVINNKCDKYIVFLPCLVHHIVSQTIFLYTCSSKTICNILFFFFLFFLNIMYSNVVNTLLRDEHSSYLFTY